MREMHVNLASWPPMKQPPIEEHPSSGTGYESQTGILAGPGVGHLRGLGAGGLNDTVLQSSCSEPGLKSAFLIFGMSGNGVCAARLRRAIARSHRRHEVTEDKLRCQEVFSVEHLRNTV